MLKIIDNYLSKKDYAILVKQLEDDNFPWFYCKEIVSTEKGLFKSQFIHLFYYHDYINSNFFKILKPLLLKLNPITLVRVKANLNPPTEKLVKHAYHKDQPFKCKIAIYYVNDNNGYTVIGGRKVNCKKNRMVLFESGIEHHGTNSTNINNRMVINFNYF